MIAADRAHVPLWEFMAQPLAWREMYRVAVSAERQAEREIRRRQERQAAARRRQGRG